MELKHREFAAVPARPKLLKLGRFGIVGATVMAAGLIYFGSQRSGSTQRETVRPAAAANLKPVAMAGMGAGGCDAIFSDQIKHDLERRIDSAVSPRSGQIRSELGVSDGSYLTFSIGVDRTGRPVIEDAWASSRGEEVDARSVVRALGVSFEGVTLARPTDGQGCSYMLSRKI